MRSYKNAFRSEKCPQFYYSILAGLQGVVIGTAVGWNSPLTQLMIKGNNEESDHITWSVTGCYCLGTVVGGLVQGLLNKKPSYRMSAVVYDLVVSIGWMTLFFEVNFYSIYVGRYIQGIGTGGLGLLIPTYLSHIADFDIRGRVQIFHQLFVCYGILFAFALSAIISYWMLIALCMTWPVLLSILTFFSSQSPVFLYKYGPDMVKTAILQIKGDNSHVELYYAELKKYMEFFVPDNIDPTTDYVTKIRRIRNITNIGIGLVVFQQTCGVNSVIFHIQRILNDLCSTDEIAIVILVVQIFVCLPVIELVEFCGRKCMLIVSAVGMAISLLGLVFMFTFITPDCFCLGIEWQSTITIALMILYMCSYTLGWGTVVMLVYTEIVYFDEWFTSLIYAGGQFTMFLIVCGLFKMDTLMGNKDMLWFYIVSCISSIAFVHFIVPDTRAKQLSQIQSMLNNKSHHY